MPEKREELYDVMVSYSHEDERQVRQLVLHLKERGLTVWHADTNIPYGGQIPLEIQESLLKSRVLLVALSPSSIKSSWVYDEWSIRLLQINAYKDKKFGLIPLHLIDCEIPLLLSNRRCCDFRDVDFNNPRTYEDKFLELVDRITQSLPPKDSLPQPKAVNFPIAIIAMNHTEAEELASCNIFDNQKQREDFDRFTKSLKSHWPHDFINRYAESREDWKPFLNDSTTIREFITRRISFSSTKFIIQPEYLSNAFLSSDTKTRNKIWHYLDQTPCLLVLDSISMFHPQIENLLNQSHLGSRDHVAVVGIYPQSSHSITANRKAEDKLKAALERTFERFEDLLAPECAFEIMDQRALNRWLHAALPKTIQAIQELRPYTENLGRVRERVPQASSDISSVIFRKGV